MQVVTLQPEDAEQKTIRAAQQGDVAAFNRLVLASQSLAYNVAYRLLGSREAAADATQDSFLKAYRSLARFRGGPFRAWLLRIVTNTCYDVLRFRRRHSISSMESDGADGEHGADNDWPSHDESPEKHAIRQEMNSTIQAAITRLPEDPRTVVVLSDIEGMTYEEIALSIGMSVGTVKSRLSRARARLRDLLEADGVLRRTL